MECQKNTTHNIRHEIIKLIKIGKELGTTHCLGCKDYTHNFKPEEVKITNKLLRKKSNCFVC